MSHLPCCPSQEPMTTLGPSLPGLVSVTSQTLLAPPPSPSGPFLPLGSPHQPPPSASCLPFFLSTPWWPASPFSSANLAVSLLSPTLHHLITSSSPTPAYRTKPELSRSPRALVSSLPPPCSSCTVGLTVLEQTAPRLLLGLCTLSPLSGIPSACLTLILSGLTDI